MQAESYDQKKGYRITLTQKERVEVYDRLSSTDDRIAWVLVAWCGLRRSAAGSVRFKDIRKKNTGDYVVRVREETEKNNRYREVPIPDTYAVLIQTRVDTSEHLSEEDEVVQQTMRSFHNHLDDILDELAEETDEEMWRWVTPHDGRRTAINYWVRQDVHPFQVMDWSGHKDYQTFRQNYLMKFSDEKTHNQIQKLDY